MAEESGGVPLKEKLENLKLEAEIAELTRPLLKRTAFWSAVAPVMLALIGLFFTWSSGWFSVQLEKLDVKKLNLEKEAQLLADSNRVLAAARQSYVTTIDSLARERLAAGRDLETTRAQRDLAPFVLHLGLIAKRSPFDADPKGPSVTALIGLLRPASVVHSQALALVKKQLEVERQPERIGNVALTRAPERRATLYYVLYKGTGQRAWRDTLFAMLDGPFVSGIYDIFKDGEWTDAEYFRACELAVARNGSELTSPLFVMYLLELLSGIEHRNKTRPLAGFSSTVAFLNAVRAARDHTLATLDDGGTRFAGLLALRALAPAAYYVVVAKLGAAGDTTSAFLVRGDLRRPRSKVAEILAIPGQPSVAAWTAWLSAHESLVALWTQPDLGKLRSNMDTLLKALVEK